LTGIALVLVLFLLPALPGAAEEDNTRLEVEVTAQEGGEPVANATIYLKFKEKRTLWKDKKREWTVKTNPDGKAVVPIIPVGRVLVQVVCPGWKTYGEFHELEGPKQTLEIKLERPRKWY
jgi:hypothetical protein